MTARLLLIDDDVRLSSMVGDYLRNSGFEVETAGSLAAGRERLGAESFDALVLDLMLPDGDGLDLCREIRAATAVRDKPVRWAISVRVVSRRALIRAKTSPTVAIPRLNTENVSYATFAV